MGFLTSMLGMAITATVVYTGYKLTQHYVTDDIITNLTLVGNIYDCINDPMALTILACELIVINS